MSIVNKVLGTAKQAARGGGSTSGARRGTTGAPGRRGTKPAAGPTNGGSLGKVLRGLRGR